MSENEYVNLVVEIDLDEGDQEDRSDLTYQLRNEISELEAESVETVREGAVPQGAKTIDPVLLGTLAVTLAPLIVPKFLEFLHAWAMRRTGCVIKIKIQKTKDSSLEIEVPATTSPAELKNWINTMQETLKPVKK